MRRRRLLKQLAAIEAQLELAIQTASSSSETAVQLADHVASQRRRIEGVEQLIPELKNLRARMDELGALADESVQAKLIELETRLLAVEKGRLPGGHQEEADTVFRDLLRAFAGLYESASVAVRWDQRSTEAIVKAWEARWEDAWAGSPDE